EAAIALDEAEAARRAVGEGADEEMIRVEERPPKLLAGAVPDGKALRIVHGGAEIVDADAVMRAEEEHAGERRDADLIDLDARIERGAHLGHGLFAGMQDEAIGAGDARAVEEGMDDEEIGLRRRLLDPELAEDREFLAARIAGVEGKAARRQAIGLAARHGAEIGGALEDDELVEIVRIVDRRVHAEAGEAEVAAVRALVDEPAIGEHVGREAQMAALPAGDDVDVDRLAIVA